MQLNPQQRRAVTNVGSPLLVLAGAGSGKTGVITRKIAWLIEQGSLSPSNVFALTFTNKAAAEMRARLAKQLERKIVKRLHISTFHRLGLKILQYEGQAVDLHKGFTILDQADSLSTLRDIVNESKLNLDEKILQHRISCWKNELVTPETALASATDSAMQASALVYARYKALLGACNSVDFDDLIFLPVTILQQNNVVLEKWQNRVKHLLVDEYQDTNLIQYTLVKLLVGESDGLTVVGDDDQSIYSWRGANPENLRQLQLDYPSLEVVKLEQNYRCSQRILRCANALISENPHVYEKRLWSKLLLGDPLKIVACESAIDEATWVAADIVNLKFRNRIRYGDVAILYRSNFQARLFEQALREQNIPYRISGGKSFFDKAEIKDVLAYLKIMVNPADDNAFIRIVNTPRREIGPATLEALGRFARAEGVSLHDACHAPTLVNALSTRAYTRLQEFANRIVLASDNAARGSVIDVIKALLEDIDYQQWLMDQAPSKTAGERAWESVDELLIWIERQCATSTEAEHGLEHVVRQLALMDFISQDEKSDDQDQVNMMTLHAAKGLEFPYVYMVGAEEAILPHRNSIEGDDIEEERRLAYVGMTRARYNLTFTWARSRQRFGESHSTEPSRFLDELPEEDIRRLGDPATAKDEQQNQLTGRETIDSLRALLNHD